MLALVWTKCYSSAFMTFKISVIDTFIVKREEFWWKGQLTSKGWCIWKPATMQNCFVIINFFRWGYSQTPTTAGSSICALHPKVYPTADPPIVEQLCVQDIMGTTQPQPSAQ